MQTTNIKSIAQRMLLLGAAAALVLATIIPSLAFADALNPLTERSLLLSSSAPGFQDTDGSGNSNLTPPDSYTPYAPPGSGPNGAQTGQTFSFRVSSDGSTRPIKAMTLQYCTKAAGYCFAPGDNLGDADPNNDGNIADSTRETNSTAKPNSRSDLDASTFNTAEFGTDFKIFVDANNDGIDDPAEDQSEDWNIEVINLEDHTRTGVDTTTTGKGNFIRLTHVDGIEPLAGQKVKIVFIASNDHYITNPGSKAFFVKINTFDTDTNDSADPAWDGNAINPTFKVSEDYSPNLIDGGVTVANVMTDSIHITTKVLETMAFSVGVENPDLTNNPHGVCDPIRTVNNNRLNLGDPNAEYSLSIAEAYDTNSYWRLSSNSSGGATVYYSGETLSNTVGDQIDAIGTSADYSHPGTEQFGLGLVSPLEVLDTNFTFPPDKLPLSLDGLVGEAAYNFAEGTISDPDTVENAQFAFDPDANTVPALLAQKTSDVISCATAKMRYVANIAANTPAGIYTTKINYLAAPQY